MAAELIMVKRPSGSLELNATNSLERQRTHGVAAHVGACLCAFHDFAAAGTNAAASQACSRTGIAAAQKGLAAFAPVPCFNIWQKVGKAQRRAIVIFCGQCRNMTQPCMHWLAPWELVFLLSVFDAGIKDFQ